MMRRGRCLVGMVVVCASLALSAGRAAAQVGAFGWSPDERRLTDEDRRLLWDATTALNRTPSPANGAALTWSNPASGNSGKVWLVRTADTNGMPCHVLHYALSFTGQPVPQEYEFTWCRTADGAWKIVTQ